jgi:Xaa-Pro aminopeptidase
LSLHEEPFIAAHTDIVLEPGMVLAIEPVHIQDKSLFWLEDNLLVTETGYESLTTALPHGMIITPTGA